MAKGIREQDCLAKQLERTRIEKEMMEKVIKAELSEAVKSSMTGEKTMAARLTVRDRYRG